MGCLLAGIVQGKAVCVDLNHQQHHMERLFFPLDLILFGLFE